MISAQVNLPGDVRIARGLGRDEAFSLHITVEGGRVQVTTGELSRSFPLPFTASAITHRGPIAESSPKVSHEVVSSAPEAKPIRMEIRVAGVCRADLPVERQARVGFEVRRVPGLLARLFRRYDFDVWWSVGGDTQHAPIHFGDVLQVTFTP